MSSGIVSVRQHVVCGTSVWCVAEPTRRFGMGWIDWRRRWISDRTWFGLAFIAMGCAQPWWSLLLWVPGGLLIASGVRRALRGVETGTERPGPPW